MTGLHCVQCAAWWSCKTKCFANKPHLHWVHWLHWYWVHWESQLSSLSHKSKPGTKVSLTLSHFDRIWTYVSKPQTQHENQGMCAQCALHTLLMYTAQKDEPLKSLLEFGQQLSLFGGQFQWQSILLSKFQKGFSVAHFTVRQRTLCIFHYTATLHWKGLLKSWQRGRCPSWLMRDSNQLQIFYP